MAEDQQPMIGLDDPGYRTTILTLTAQIAAAAQENGGDFNTPLSALVFVLSMMLEVDPAMVTPGNLRKRSDEIARVVLDQMKWMRGQREAMGKPMFHQIMQEVAELGVAGNA